MDDLDWIREGLQKPGKTRTGIAQALRRRPSAVTALLKGERQLKASEIRPIAEYLEVEVPARPEGVPIVGLAGAGPNGSVIYSEGDGNLGLAPLPPKWTPDTVALEVRGTSMRGIAYEGWVVYYRDRRGEITARMFGKPCVLELDDGQVVVKLPFPGREPGHFDLESTNQAFDTMRDQRVVWASPITWIATKEATDDFDDLPEGEAKV